MHIQESNQIKQYITLKPHSMQTIETPEKIQALAHETILNNTIAKTSQSNKIRNQIFLVYKNNTLRGHIKVLDLASLSQVQVIFYHTIHQYKVQQNIKILFGQKYPKQPPSISIHSCNLTQIHQEYIIPNFLTMNQLLDQQLWSEQTRIADILAKIYQTIHDFHISEIQRLFASPEQQAASIELEQELDDISSLSKQKIDDKLSQKKKRLRRQSSNMTGCADKQLTQTKNLNRHFRSKLREVLRDLCPTSQQENADFKYIDDIFTPNRVGFEDIRKALYNKWFNDGVKRQVNSGQFLHKILRGMMGIKSKKLMIKYYHVMVSAVEDPYSFIRWKYD